MRCIYTMAIVSIALLSFTHSFGQESEIKHDGIVFPVMATQPASAVKGQVIYYTGTNPDEYQYYDGSSWLP